MRHPIYNRFLWVILLNFCPISKYRSHTHTISYLLISVKHSSVLIFSWAFQHKRHRFGEKEGRTGRWGIQTKQNSRHLQRTRSRIRGNVVDTSCYVPTLFVWFKDMRKKMSEFALKKDTFEAYFHKQSDDLDSKKKNLKEKSDMQLAMICSKKKDIAELRNLIGKQKYTVKDKQAVMEKRHELQRNLELKKSQFEAVTALIDPHDKEIVSARKLVSAVKCWYWNGYRKRVRVAKTLGNVEVESNKLRWKRVVSRDIK